MMKTTTRSFATVANRLHATARDDDVGAGDRIVLTRREPEPGNARDTRQRFAAKTERPDGGQIGGRTNFACGMTLETKQSVVAIHPDAVIVHTNQRDAAAPNQCLDLLRASIDAVLDQLFYDRGRPFDYLTGRHLAGESLGKKMNAAHAI